MAETVTRYVCDTCPAYFVTARGFKAHADREHSHLDHEQRAQATKQELPKAVVY